MKIRFISKFHPRWFTTLNIKEDKPLSKYQLKKLRCSPDCHCGGLKPEKGAIEQYRDGLYWEVDE